jgi:uncharacterized protein (DUF1800 family)
MPTTAAAIAWGQPQAAHLLRRASFGATPAELRQAVRAGLEATVDRLLGAPQSAFVQQQPASPRGGDAPALRALQEGWIDRMLQTRRPLEERMTFFWHNHFATSIVTVQHAPLMVRQNRLFQTYALGNVRQLAVAVARDPAMLLWLDNHLSRRERPNENFGRELLELFLLGHGHYRESDVFSAVRSLTGWTLSGEGAAAQFRFDAAEHDDAEKTFLGNAGLWNGDDTIRMACEQPAHAAFLVRKLCAFFAYPDPERELVERLSKIYLDARGELRPLLRALFTSPEMYSPRAMWSIYKTPLDHALIAWRQLGIAPDAGVIADSLQRQGLVLFNPPDVSGWRMGRAWINSWTLLARFDFAALAAQRFPLEQRDLDPPAAVDFYLDRLGPLPAAPALRDQLVAHAAGISDPGERQRGVVRLILSSPEWQLN